MRRMLMLTLLFSIYSVHAQFYPSNARMSGLAGVFIIDDPVDMLRYPVFVNKYADMAQVTFNSPIIGVKSVGDVFTIGIVANRGYLLDSSATGFYQTGSSALAATITQLPGALQVQKVPHILLGIDLSMVSLGFDLFYEYASAFYEQETTATPAITTTAKTRMRNPGLVASALFGPENISVAAKVAMSFPSIYGNVDDGTTKTEVTSDKGLYLQVGAEASMNVKEILVTAGTDLNFESYAFVRDTFPSAMNFTKNRIAAYAGVEGEMFTTAKWGVQTTLYFPGAKTTSTTDTTSVGSVVFSLSGAIENVWTSVWIFDECAARGGLIYMTSAQHAKSQTAASSTVTKSPTLYPPVQPTVGIGVKKSAFALDLTVNPAAWGSLVTGPAVGMVTGTFTF